MDRIRSRSINEQTDDQTGKSISVIEWQNQRLMVAVVMVMPTVYIRFCEPKQGDIYMLDWTGLGTKNVSHHI
jgi:hypothetical protein